MAKLVQNWTLFLACYCQTCLYSRYRRSALELFIFRLDTGSLTTAIGLRTLEVYGDNKSIVVASGRDILLP